ncbi:MAG: LD-carboxypeptidase, partial [Pseudobutyrivibrio sp.]|nr:LD-carboxypeptidase [Pseudobutyrivibrio sp.]
MKVGLSACSNGHGKEWMPQIKELEKVLTSMNVEPILVENIEAKIDEFSGTDEERAADLMALYKDDSVSAIYDISGGDLANGVLKYLDFDVIAKSNKTFWGYSDLTTIINAIYTMTNKPSVLYQVKNMVYSEAELQRN